MDLIDTLIDTLNDRTGITFDRDVLDTNRPEDWGAVELVGSEDEWADDTMIDQTLNLDIWVCISDKGSGTFLEVQEALLGFAQEYEFTWKFQQRSYLYDLDKVLFRWTARMWGPIESTDAAGGAEAGGDETGGETAGDGD